MRAGQREGSAKGLLDRQGRGRLQGGQALRRTGRGQRASERATAGLSPAPTDNLAKGPAARTDLLAQLQGLGTKTQAWLHRAPSYSGSPLLLGTCSVPSSVPGVQ